MRQEEDSIFLSSLESLPKRQCSAVSISILHCIVVSCGKLASCKQPCFRRGWYSEPIILFFL